MKRLGTPHLPIFLLFSTSWASPGVAQHEVYQQLGQSDGDRFGNAVIAFDDLDGDGVRDLLVGAPVSNLGGVWAGSVYALSGASGAQLYRVDGSSAEEYFGWSLAPLSDLDGDGTAEWIVGAPRYSSPLGMVGRADVRSGASGALLFSITGSELYGMLGHAVAGTGDTNADGVPDVVVSTPHSNVSAPGAGAVVVYSGVDGSFIRGHYGNWDYGRFGFVLADLGDVDGDGHNDFATGSMWMALERGEVRVYSGATLYLQVAYREHGVGPCSGALNFSQGLELPLLP